MSEPPAPTLPEDDKEEKETEQDLDKAQLSSSVIIEVPNVQPSLELSTITGNGAMINDFQMLIMRTSLSLGASLSCLMMTCDRATCGSTYSYRAQVLVKICG